MMKMLIPTTIDLDATRIPGVRTVAYDPAERIAADDLDAEILVVWGNDAAQLEHAATNMRRLRWIATLAAGPDGVLKAGFADTVTITSGRALHAAPVAEHTLGLLLAAARRLHTLRDLQRDAVWAAHLGGIQPRHEPGAFRSLIGAHVVIWGYGSIGQRLGAYLTAMDARVTGVARSAGERGGVPVVSVNDVDDALRGADALVMILPSLPATRGILDARRLRLLPPRAWVVNVGRGDTVDEAALIEVLASGHLGGAALDVFAAEPLPKDSPLWRLPNVIVSPHAAGGRPLDAEALLAENVERIARGEALRNTVERA
ncbi:phosphoglycerate dehydrogenase [soil metagenome]